MLRFIGLILMRTAFVCVLLFFAFVALASLLGYPGFFVAVAFSLGGLPIWVLVRRYRPMLALLLAAVACIVPVLLLIVYPADEDPPLIIHVPILALFAYAFAYAGIEAGRFVWLPPERRRANGEPNPRPLPLGGKG
jgi:hypothetical protein